MSVEVGRKVIDKTYWRKREVGVALQLKRMRVDYFEKV